MGIDARTPVPTASGWVPAKLLRAGDTVYTYDGKPTKVTVVQLYTPKECYKARLQTGLALVGDMRTMLPALNSKQIGYASKWGRRQAKKRPIVIRPMPMDELSGGNYLINAKPLQFPERDLPVDPYELGRWIFMLGAKKKASRTDITRNLIERYPTIPHYIPDEYMFSSFEQRLALLRGLFADRKKPYSAHLNRYQYASRDIKQLRQVQNLLESMGIHTVLACDTISLLTFRTCLRLFEYQDEVFKSIYMDFRRLEEVFPIEPRECAYIKTESPSNTLVMGEGFLCVTL
jgi:hypothetical protein